MKHAVRNTAVVVIVIVVVAVVGIRLSGDSLLTIAGMALNTVRSANNPAGTLAVEINPSTPMVDAPATAPVADATPDAVAAGEWPSYNRTLTSARYSPLNRISRGNVQKLKIVCTYDTGLHESFETAPIVVDGALIFTSATDTYSIDPGTCRENWHARDHYKMTTALITNRGAAFLDGRVFRGTLNGRVLAYDARTGKKLWDTTIADPTTGELIDAAPLAWDGRVYIGTALGDIKGVKGRMYALDAASGKIAWETYLIPRQSSDPTRGVQGRMPDVRDTWSNRNTAGLPISGGGTWTSYTIDPANGHLYVPVGNPSPDFVQGVRTGTNLYTNSVVTLDARTGDYISHYQIAASDWHDWDVSNAPTLITTRGGKHLLAFTPKDGNLYGYDLDTGALAYRSAVTRIENADAPLNTEKETHFCPGALGGGEWNGPAYAPGTNLLYSGDDDWCTAVKLVPKKKIKEAADGSLWMGADTFNPLDVMGTQDPHSDWAGWLYATDADSGQWRWRARSNYPILSGVTPTAGGLVFFGDMGGNFYALDARNGALLFHQKLAGAVSGGVISYAVDGVQRVAAAVGMTSPIWPTEVATGKIVVLGLDKGPATQQQPDR